MAKEALAKPQVIDRRALCSAGAIWSIFCSLSAGVLSAQTQANSKSKIACFIRYQIDPFQRDAFQAYAENWGRIIPRLGGDLLGYFLPYEGTNDVAWGLIAFENLAAYERYRALLKTDAEARENIRVVQSKKVILREERNFVEIVNGTFERPALNGKPA